MKILLSILLFFLKLKVIATLLILSLTTYVAYLLYFDHLLINETKHSSRDPITGVIIGTEARTISPEENDKKAAILMIHGFSSSRQDFDNLGEELANLGYTVREMRLPGHGTTPVEFAYQDKDSLYNAADKELEKLRQEFSEIHLVGFSTGGAICTILASKYQVVSLTLLSPFFRIARHPKLVLPMEYYCYATYHFIPYFRKIRGITTINNTENKNKFFRYKTMPNRGLYQIIKLSEIARDKKTLAEISMPVLLCQSPSDTVTSYKASCKALEEMPSTSKTIFEATKSNHIILHDFDQQEVKQKVLDFISNTTNE